MSLLDWSEWFLNASIALAVVTISFSIFLVIDVARRAKNVKAPPPPSDD